MSFLPPYFRPNRFLRYLFRWVLSIVPLSIAIGLVVALFLWLLDTVTRIRWQHPRLPWFLPLAGIAIVWLYRSYGKNASAGNNLIIDEIHNPGGGVPPRMGPLIFCTTLITHLFGGSAGREGTAVQMGGSMAAFFAGFRKLVSADKRTLLLCGMSAGFGAVFGTPVAGAVFALEVLTSGRARYDALIHCLLAGFVADFTCTFCGIHHTVYPMASRGYALDEGLLWQVLAAGVLFGLVARLFVFASHGIGELGRKRIADPRLLTLTGGCLVISISYALGSFDYLGIGVTNPEPGGISIVSAFHPGGAATWSWFWKLLLTAITLSTGFKGGEVTPLFFIGATLGNTIAAASGAPTDLLAGLGFLAVFAAAANTPWACVLMGIELFGPGNAVYFIITCFTAYYVSGHVGIYRSQRRSGRGWRL